jgi:GNAT superfamily N-acetyltransferase
MTTRGAHTITIDNVTTNAADPFAALSDILRSYNSQHMHSEESLPVWLFARDETGKVQGGLRGRSFWGWCFIETLAVADGHRGQGIGTKLLVEAEAVAKARGCIGIYLTTVAFQAPDFYRKNGYHQFGQLADFPKGFAQYWFAKRLDGAPLNVVTQSVTPS